MWLEDMVELFTERHAKWKIDHQACQTATQLIPSKVEECTAEARKVADQQEKCGKELLTLESLSCGWAKEYESRCSSYGSCYLSVLKRRSDAIKEAKESVVRWKKSWLAASRMECMAHAMNASSVNETAMHACNSENITDISFIKIVVEEPPVKVVCPTPEIFPGSLSYKEAVYDKLPSGLTVRQPTSCPWSSDKMVLKGAGCCRFTNWKASRIGMLTPDKCVSTCLANEDCKAADIARPKDGLYDCFHFFGDAFQNFVLSCNTKSATEKCYRRESPHSACKFYTYKGTYTGLLDQISAPAYGVKAQQSSATRGEISSLMLSGAPGCQAIFYCDENCMSNTHFGGGFQVRPYKFVFNIGPDGQEVKRALSDLKVTQFENGNDQHLQGVVNARVSVSMVQPLMEAPQEPPPREVVACTGFRMTP
jgi:hypothetical protein